MTHVFYLYRSTRHTHRHSLAGSPDHLEKAVQGGRDEEKGAACGTSILQKSLVVKSSFACV